MSERLPHLAGIGALPGLYADVTEPILMADVDPSGYTYFACYYRRAEAGFGALMRAAGTRLSDLLEGDYTTPAVSSRCDYFAGAHLDDLIRQVCVARASAASRSLVSDHHFVNEAGVQVATVRITRAIVETATRRPVSGGEVIEHAGGSGLGLLLRAVLSG